MARYKLILAYDGTDFHGFQRQGSIRTVQLSIESALSRLQWKGKSILAAGRTDSGVHASGQVVTFDLDWKHTLKDLGNALNAHLPKDIGISEIVECDHEFHPRYDASSRRYQYQIYCQPARDPLKQRFAWRLTPVPDFGLLESAANLLIGTYDFSAFGSPMKPGGSTTRTLSLASWNQVSTNSLSFDIAANAFLYHMVRRMVFLQVQVGLGKIELQDFEQAVKTCKELKPGLAPPQGLTLIEVEYKRNTEMEA
ncbi:MAG: tRNA pseudouridine(38-40) synthase TruA [Anaerolineaceae bacterium]|nr:tRNA pseudouridine(38-40) synthase TruA [Anaerolineaceae bacterium]